MRLVKHLFLLLAFLSTLSSPSIRAAQVSVAVAANFAGPAQKLAVTFEQETGNKAVISIGSTGKFYTQIKNGAPFEVLLAADDETPIRLEGEGFGVVNTRFTYAIGKLVLWSKQVGIVDDRGEVLRRGGFEHIAIADPRLAPYGLAAMQAIGKMGLEKQLLPKAVWGENISQTYLYVDSQAASLGFVALSQVIQDGKVREGSTWLVPPSMYSMIRQDAILLSTGKNNPAADAFMRFMRSKKAQEIIQSFGYSL